ncbi:hypothetical protein FACS1894162_2910 [Bacteroidia bacterium]|nr:hypothetical protein FACS1894162_2910 [Bacteroidia bacterium]
MVERCEELDAKYNEFSTFAWKNQTYDMECKDLWKAIEGDDFKNRPFLDDVNTQWSNIAGRDYVCNIALLAGDVGRLTELMTLYMQSFYRYRSRWSEWYTCTNIGKFPVK